MKKHSLLLLIFFLLGFGKQYHVCAQENLPPMQEQASFRVWYKWTIHTSRLAEPFTLIDTMALEVSPRASQFYDWGSIARDSLDKAFLKNEIMLKSRSITVKKDVELSLADVLESSNLVSTSLENHTLAKVNIYKLRGEKRVISVVQGPAQLSKKKLMYVVDEELPMDEWTLGEDTATILGYPCKSATIHFRGRDYTAWYTEELPVNDGPWKFYGLPGMILKVQDADGIICFEAVGLQEISQPITYPKADEFETISNKEFWVYQEEQFKHITPRLLEDRTMVIVQMKNPVQYVPIELEN